MLKQEKIEKTAMFALYLHLDLHAILLFGIWPPGHVVTTTGININYEFRKPQKYI
jgi:hypothetical protein